MKDAREAFHAGRSTLLARLFQLVAAAVARARSWPRNLLAVNQNCDKSKTTTTGGVLAANEGTFSVLLFISCSALALPEYHDSPLDSGGLFAASHYRSAAGKVIAAESLACRG